MTYVARSEYCTFCGGMHPKFLDGCPDNPLKGTELTALLIGMKVDPTSNKRGVYHTLWFKCPKCEYDSVMVKSNYCSNCGVKLSWES